METKVSTVAELPIYARDFLSRFPHGTIVGLSGDLGAGKTTLVRAMIAELTGPDRKPRPRVVSPSFVIHLAYSDLNRPVDHFDLYRLAEVGEPALVELGYFEIIDECRRRGGLVFVEWPEHAQDISFLALDVRVQISFLDEGRCYQEV